MTTTGRLGSLTSWLGNIRLADPGTAIGPVSGVTGHATWTGSTGGDVLNAGGLIVGITADATWTATPGTVASGSSPANVPGVVAHAVWTVHAGGVTIGPVSGVTGHASWAGHPGAVDTAARTVLSALWAALAQQPVGQLVAVCRVRLGGSYTSGAESEPVGAFSRREVVWDPDGGLYPAIELRASEVDVSIPLGDGSISPATARVFVPELTPDMVSGIMRPIEGRQPLVIELGYLDTSTDPPTPLYAPVFTGWSAELDVSYWPAGATIGGVGMLSQANFAVRAQVTIRQQAEWEAARKLIRSAGILGYDVDGLEEHDVATVTPVLLREGQPVASLLSELDAASQYFWHDAEDGTPKRRRFPGVTGELGTTATAALSRTWAPGRYPILDEAIERQRDPSRSRDFVKVLGRMPDDPERTRAAAYRSVASAWVAGDSAVVARASSDAIQDEAYAAHCAEVVMRRVNKLFDVFDIETIGTPYIKTGKLVEVYHERVAVSDGTDALMYCVTGTRDRWTPGVWRRTLSLEGTENGGRGTAVETRPDAGFSFEWDGPDGDGYYAVTCTNESDDPTGPDDALSLEWSNDQNGQALSGDADSAGVAVFVFSQGEWDASGGDGPVIFLTAVSADGIPDTIDAHPRID